MSSHTYAETSSATMRSGFPTPPEPTLGAPNLFIFNNLLQYICKCTHTHKPTIFKKKIKLLHLMVDTSLYTHPDDNYPFPNNVDEVPDLKACTNDNKRVTAKLTHTILLKMRNDVVNMNAALANIFDQPHPEGIQTPL
jgi:hypothetical protein